MAHDGQDISLITDPRLPDLMALTAAALPAVDDILARAKTHLRATVTEGDRISARLIEENQTAAHGFAWLATYAQALHQMQAWADKLTGMGKFGEVEQLIHQIAFGDHPMELDELAGVLGGHPLEVLDEGLSPVADVRVVLPVLGADVPLDGLGRSALVEHQVVERDRVPLVPGECLVGRRGRRDR